MSRFGLDPHAFFDAVYREAAPWDIGGPQPAMSELLKAYPPKGPVLDVGCGSGDRAIFLAQGGLHVLGIDFVDAAIEQAREKARSLPPEIAHLLEFQVADALQLSLLEKQFASVVDSGFFHLLEPDQCDRFVDELASTLLPGGRYYLLAFAVDFAIPDVPRGISEEELRFRFTSKKGWRIQELRSSEFQSRVAPVPAISTCIERLPMTHT